MLYKYLQGNKFCDHPFELKLKPLLYTGKMPEIKKNCPENKLKISHTLKCPN